MADWFANQSTTGVNRKPLVAVSVKPAIVVGLVLSVIGLVGVLSVMDEVIQVQKSASQTSRVIHDLMTQSEYRSTGWRQATCPVWSVAHFTDQ